MSRIEPLGHEPPPRSFHNNVQMVASAAHLRGVVLVRGETIVGSVEARDLCRTLRAAHEATRGDDHAHAHVERLAFGITLKLGAKGAVQVSRSAMNLLEGYAKRQRQNKKGPSTTLRPARDDSVTTRSWNHPTDVRIALKQHYRMLAWQRQEGRCLYCTRLLALTEVTADHRLAQVKGGREDADNIDATCERCNRLKGRYPYQAFLRAIHAPDLVRDGWRLHVAGVEVRIMRRAAQALDRLREFAPNPALSSRAKSRDLSSVRR